MSASRAARIAAAAVVLAVAVLSGCQKNEVATGHLVLPATSVISTSEQRAVIAADSLRVRAQPSVRAQVLSHFRRGEVVEVLRRGEIEERVAGDLGYWFEVTHQGVRGWVFGSHLELVTPGVDAAEVVARVRDVRAAGD
jgi:DNA-directed RNA polymerase subunit H (RpoH/RPB5)